MPPCEPSPTLFRHEAPEGEETHDCATYTPEGLSQAEDDSIPDSEILFVEWSSTIDQETRVRHTGAAVVVERSSSPAEELQVAARLTLLPHLSAQSAELIALIEALMQSTDKIVNIYSDSTYVTTTELSSIARWRRQGFLKSDGRPVMHRELLKRLIDALALPKRVALVKCALHT